MAGGKQTPRQRMINILYLVLLGLIALNVPDSLLDAFKKIGDSLATSTSNVQSGINNTYSAFEKTHLKDEPVKAQPLYNKSKEASELASKLNTKIEELKKTLIEKSGGMDENTGDYRGRDNMDVTPHIMIDQKKATELRKDINDTREKLIALLDPKDRNGINVSLTAEDPIPAKNAEKKSWEQAYFGEGIPMGAAMTSLIKIQSDAKNAESEVIKKILSKFDQAVVNLDKFAAVAVAPSSYVVVGQPYTAQVFLTASDSHSNPDISVNGSKLPTKEGQGTYVGGSGKEGVYTWKGVIRVKQTDGTMKTYETPPQTYQVAKPSAVVSPDKMNVLYIGVSNPLSVSAPGIAVEKLKVSMSNGSLSGSKGHYEARVTSIGTTKVSISAEVAPGKTQLLGSTEFRIKRIPDPKAQFAGKSGGSTSAVNLRSQDRLFAKLENFEFDAKFTIRSFKMIVAKPHQDGVVSSSSSGELSGTQRAALATITPGTTIYFDDITAVGPDGAQRGLDPIIFKAQ
ncbi:type IX secretion system motor protein PorM/GldM [Mucilaginibacter paludis]|uniref:Gliding motility-associated protein GldM n=1 Tax=Mucilaginibacter paludis DSM 18603 TaxID=714943 RepID=H1Y4N4_9SPHI|nr:gliding motility protein GldM [Mucilaginibacter paludis]EHQ28078.1 gliding motility-associated protein GldM [Mucilaginibacter paludis DSM 18603]